MPVGQHQANVFYFQQSQRGQWTRRWITISLYANNLHIQKGCLQGSNIIITVPQKQNMADVGMGLARRKQGGGTAVRVGKHQESHFISTDLLSLHKMIAEMG
jgi:hypothetical protein